MIRGGSSARPPRMLWYASILLVVSIIINYIDRGNLAVAAPLIKTELGLSSSSLGILLSAFFWTYASFQLVSGWLVDRYNPNWVLAGGFLLWSLGTAGTGLIGGFESLLVMRLLVGMAESVAYPAYSKILATYFDENRRGLVNSWIDVGCKCGPALGTFAGGILMAHFGWRPFFVLLGLGALPWLPFWAKWMPHGPGLAVSVDQPRPSVGEILSHPAAWVTFAGQFCTNYLWSFLVTWLPSYLVRERHFSMQMMGVVGALPFVFTAAATTVTAWLSYRAIAAGAAPMRVRRTCSSIGLGFASIIVAVPFIGDTEAAMVLLMLAATSYGICTGSCWAITQTLAGPVAAGRWTGLQNCIGNLAGVVAPAVTGFVLQTSGHYYWAFILAAGVALTGSMVYLFGLRSVEPIKWRSPAVGVPI